MVLSSKFTSCVTFLVSLPAMFYQCTMQQGLTFEKEAITKCSLKIDFSANFHLAHDFFLAEALSTPQKLENPKRNLQISI